MRRRKLLAGLALAAIGLATQARAADPVRVGLAAIYPPYGITFAAQELGYYKQKNLDVSLTNFPSGPAAQEALAAGAVDVVTISPPGAALAINKGVAERIIAPTGDVTPQGWILAVPASSPIKSLSDLAGKTVGISSKGSTTDFLALWAARKANVTFRTIPLGTPGELPALKAHQIDAAVLWPLVSYRSTLSGDYRSIADFGVIMEPVLPDTWGASIAAIQKNPDALRRWLQANSMAIVYMQQHEDWTIDFLHRYTSEADPKVLKMTYDSIIKNMRPDGIMEPRWMTNSLALASDAGIEGLPGADKIFQSGFTPIDYK
jgi:NitT/TauT family transport system substrate-binding protein